MNNSGRAGLIAACIIAVTAMVFHANGLSNGFVWDDDWYVVENEGIRRSWSHIFEHFSAPDLYMRGLDTPICPIWRPLRNISYTVDYSLWQLNPFGYHLSNLVLHVLNCVLLFLVSSRLMGKTAAGFAAGMIYAVHPVLTEAIAWIKGRDDLLVSFFFLSATLCFLHILDNPKLGRWSLLFLFLVVCTLLSKEAGICLIPTMLAFCFFRRANYQAAIAQKDASRQEGQRLFPRSVITLCLIGFGLTVLYVYVRTIILGRLSQMPLTSDRLTSTYLTMVHVMVYYFQLAILPINLTCDYSAFPVIKSWLEPAFLLSFAWLLCLAVLVFRIRHRAPWLAFGVIWFYVNLVPVSNVVPTMQLLAERFLYLPMAGICMASGALFAEVYDRLRDNGVWPRRFLYCLTALILSLLGAGTIARNTEWKNTQTVFEAALKVSPDNVRMGHMLAITAVNQGKYDRVIELLDGQISIDASTATMLRNLGYALYQTGERERGLDLLRAAIRKGPDFAQPYEDLGHIRVGDGKFLEAVKWFGLSVKYDPLNDTRWVNLGLTYLNAGDLHCARRATQFALRLNSRNVDAIRTLVSLNWREERWEQCELYLQQMLEINPSDSYARYWLKQVREKSQERN